MGFKSKATKANKAKKQEREPIKRKATGVRYVLRTDIRPSHMYNRSGVVAHEFNGEGTKEECIEEVKRKTEQTYGDRR